MCKRCGCPKCGFSGWIIDGRDKDGYEENRPCDCNVHWFMGADYQWKRADKQPQRKAA